jgi:hypothetical protein
MRTLGFIDATVTASGADRGLDVIATGAAAQVKLHKKPTGAPSVQQLHGAAASYRTRVFYSQAFTPQAITTANRLLIALFRFDQRGTVTAANPPAVELLTNRGGRVTPVHRESAQLSRWADQILARTSMPSAARRSKKAHQETRTRRHVAAQVRGVQRELEGVHRLSKRDARRVLSRLKKTLKGAAQTVGVELR